MRRLLALIAIVTGLLVWGYANSLADPVMRKAQLGLVDWPADAPLIKVALIADLHVQGPDMPPARIARIAAQIAATQPDLILIAGDFVGDRELSTRQFSDGEIARAVAEFRAPLGVWAVLGNHDHWRGGAPLAKALRAAGVHILQNQAARVGPITLAGIGDDYTDHADITAVTRAAANLPGPLVAFTHSPDVIPNLPPRFALLLAGHTHCGQVVLPLVGTVQGSSHYGDRYGCGVVREGPHTAIVTAGLGTSVVPLRFGARPDWWLITLGPPR